VTRLRPGGDEDQGGQDGSTSHLMASGIKRVPTRWGSRRRQSAARWGSPTQTLVRCRWGSHEYVRRSSVSVRTGMCAVGRGEQRGSTPRVYVFAFVRASAAWPRGRHKTDGACMATAQRRELNEQI
jgi:hypothetical protein